ncbi:ATPase inhibitor IATP mitochondria [Penicillium bovifimosum]|uniref:ATPase inhibitor, mitochondrial n=1 Tax=Penicillium bovifimosum TaxID=126998 RepID=A0A9W9L856_9EURO|nr:ATPase inhibitor IATP mitochondria [Penicillium bovifimosum]KAJ5142548.1 ATPase inhibitor IATP mitochondria [Penicillium bovifimosum]
MQSISRPILRITTNPALLRTLSTSPRAMGAGDLGSPKSHGFTSTEKDSFTRREAAHEGMYIRQQELDKVRRLKLKLKEQRKHMDELDKHLDEFSKAQGGEQN